ncbi:hypothetical protein B0T18DRAFT_472900 [Schizothecium vesticola]|uniref:PLP-dependent transferase n=1 Tax=Schizothecium vesticola TaxID=314040 RepID=A0AA40EL32_9PEZI|nr:hypothetical protein B0T18DRAFT_472900 [Schizothecium vesticola]
MEPPIISTPSLDHDFNNTWGIILSSTETKNRPLAGALFREYWNDPVSAERRYSKMLCQYTDMFEEFFNGWLPISYHGHVTDAMCPTTTASMMLRLSMFEMAGCRLGRPTSNPELRSTAAKRLGWDGIHLSAPCFALIENGYGAAMGPLASISPRSAWRDVSTGAPSIAVRLADLVSPPVLLRTLTDAKWGGCIGVIVEIVQNQASGRVLSPHELHSLREACTETGLLLAVDEALTAIHCGAPFAHQRPKYSGTVSPDLVFFGKALVVSGVGIRFDAPFTSKLGIRTTLDRRNTLEVWQYTGTQAMPMPLLISALGALEMAVAGDWVGRSKVIGRNSRELVSARDRRLGPRGLGGEDKVLGGLESFIFVRIEVFTTFMVMVATNRGPSTGWVRWLPRLDAHLMEEATLASILSATGTEWWKSFSVALERMGMEPEWCFWCGNHARNTRDVWCRTCCINACEVAGCLEQLAMHQCSKGKKS